MENITATPSKNSPFKAKLAGALGKVSTACDRFITWKIGNAGTLMFFFSCLAVGAGLCGSIAGRTAFRYDHNQVQQDQALIQSALPEATAQVASARAVIQSAVLEYGLTPIVDSQTQMMNGLTGPSEKVKTVAAQLVASRQLPEVATGNYVPGTLEQKSSIELADPQSVARQKVSSHLINNNYTGTILASIIGLVTGLVCGGKVYFKQNDIAGAIGRRALSLKHKLEM